jgi:hypothetical protein
MNNNNNKNKENKGIHKASIFRNFTSFFYPKKKIINLKK